MAVWCIIWVLLPTTHTHTPHVSQSHTQRERERGSHLGQHISHHSPTLILRHVRQLRPREGVVEVVFHLIVLGETEQVTVLHVQQILGLNGEDNTLAHFLHTQRECAHPRTPNVHGYSLSLSLSLSRNSERSKCERVQLVVLFN